ncbi:hypothetical protein [Streptomyces sp. NPDC005970]|uniref:hypothetical protein n=1 Tax=Streptomyces sp. NPDC005970 TaxID=3156723 RepID=UPI0033CE90EF
MRDAVPLYLLIDTGMRIGGVVGADHADLGFQDGHRGLWYRNKAGNAVRYATRQFRTIGKQPSVKGERRLARLGVEATELVKKDGFGMSAMETKPWQTMVRVRVGNALSVVTLVVPMGKFAPAVRLPRAQAAVLPHRRQGRSPHVRV